MDCFFWIAFFLLTFSKYCFLGGVYPWQLDDYISFGTYSLFSPKTLYFDQIHGYADRPLANFLDVFFWCRFDDRMFLLLCLMTLLQLVSVYLLARTCRELGWEITPWLAACCLLLPMGMEATLWLSAATRILTAQFLLALSLRCRKNTWFALWLGLSFLCYEPMTALGFCFSLLVCWKRKRGILLPPLLLFLLGIYYILLSSHGLNAQRTGLLQHPLSHTLLVVREMGVCWGRGLWSVPLHSLPRGWELLCTRPGGWLLGIACLLLIVLLCRSLPPTRSPKWVGAGLFFAPYLPFFLLEQIRLPFRTAYPAFLGLAFLLSRIPLPRRLYQVGFALFLGVSLLTCWGEADAYLTGFYQDTQIIRQVAQGEDATVFPPKKIAQHADHILSVTSAEWVWTGALRAYFRDPSISPASGNFPSLP